MGCRRRYGDWEDTSSCKFLYPIPLNPDSKPFPQIISDLIEDLGIKLQVTEESIRQRIDEERGALGLKPLPPHEDKPGPFHYLKKKEDSSEEVRRGKVYSISF